MMIARVMYPRIMPVFAWVDPMPVLFAAVLPVWPNTTARSAGMNAVTAAPIPKSGMIDQMPMVMATMPSTIAVTACPLLGGLMNCW